MTKDIHRANYVIKTLMGTKCPALVDYSILELKDENYQMNYSPEGLIPLNKYIKGLNTQSLGFESFTKLLGALRAICEATMPLKDWYIDYSHVEFDKNQIFLNEDGTKAFFVLCENSEIEVMFIDKFLSLLQDLKEEYENIDAVYDKLAGGNLYSPMQVLRILSLWQLELTGSGCINP